MENIAETDHVLNMRKVLEVADNAIKKNESPFAAGILYDGDLFICHNLSRITGNPNMHAEVVCINEFCRKYKASKLNEAIMYSSCEPCLMCLHSIFNVGINKLFYSATIDDAIRYGSGDISISVSDYINKMNMGIKIQGGLLRDEMCDIFCKCIKLRGEL